MRGVSRRGLLIGGGAGVGLFVAWGVWPRDYAPSLGRAPGEQVFNGFVKIAADGHVTVAVPQAEMGQGVYTTLPQIVADELGADWRTVGVEAAPVSSLYANTLFAREFLGESLPGALVDEWATRGALMVTGASTSVRGFEDRLRDAGAAARTLLCIAAANRWDADWRACDTAGGFVVRGDDRLRFGALAEEAAGLNLPNDVARRTGRENRLTGKQLPRLDVPAKVDGSATFAGDVRLPDMVFAAIAQGPLGDTKLKSVDRAAADRVQGVLSVVETERWTAAVATNGWAAQRGVDAMKPVFETGGAPTLRPIPDEVFDAGERFVAIGDVGSAFRGATLRTAEYDAGLAPHAAIEPVVATARYERGQLELWIGTQVPGLARDAAARAIGVDASRVTIYPTLIGGSFGRRYETEVAGQAAVLAERLRRPVQLTWSRAEDMRQDRFRPAARARMAAKLGAGGRIEAWLAKIAAPATSRELKRRVFDGDSAHAAMRELRADRQAVHGATPPYAIAHVAVDHHPAELGIPTGDWRGRAHGINAFFTECFVDELAHESGGEPFSYRMAMLGANPRLALCLSKAAALGGWEGGVRGSGQGLACHSMAGSHVAVLADADLAANGRVRVNRLVAVADCGRVINPDVVKQQIAGGLIFGMSAATGTPVAVERGLASPTRLGALKLPRMADTPDILIELIVSRAPSGGVGEIAVPPVAPAIANALFTATGKRFRSLPLLAG